METKWTPGPWVDDGTNSLFAGSKMVAIVCDETGNNYGGVFADGEASANAHLIAAALDMAPLVEILASLPIATNAKDDVPLYGLDGVYITHGHVRAARAALAKVRGEA